MPALPTMPAVPQANQLKRIVIPPITVRMERKNTITPVKSIGNKKTSTDRPVSRRCISEMANMAIMADQIKKISEKKK